MDAAVQLRLGSGRAARYWAAEQAPATLRAYASDWRNWATWCRFHGLAEAPAAAGAIEEHLAWLADAGRSISTVRRRAAGIAHGLRARSAAAPDMREFLGCVARALSPPPPRSAPPVSAGDIRAIAAALDARRRAGDRLAARDRALLLLGWAGALRRGELVGLDWPDLAMAEGGVVLMLRRTKRRAGAVEHRVPSGGEPARCPAAALADWRQAGRGFSGAVFRRFLRSGRPADGRLGAASVGAVLRRRAAEAGIEADGWSAHSLRSGGLTAAAIAGADRHELLRHSRHRRGETLDGYIQPAQAWSRHPARGLL